MVKEKSKTFRVESVTRNILNELESEINSSNGRANLANIRNSINRPLTESIDLLPLLFRYLPEDFLSSDGKLSLEEKAIVTTIQLYSLHQQAESESVLLSDDAEKWKNFGYSLSFLRKGEDSLAADRRFNTMITSSTFEELSHHMRQMIKLLKSKTDAKVNYTKLSGDLYKFLTGYGEEVKFSWASRYYFVKNEKEEGVEENEN
ncbi:MAG: type I-E CRISPR-associated protein Cse2/CasB [Peptoniphilus grossensis]|uniref:type I-E CRISPR-associated protein Cse2/CasB n=1 Tax=Peptoniphilus grossensis TaxID=1465756 RepID=UPI00290FB76A|nr:type I-E CRISPR-associated protein Cse2/CasB [Peptoniphilus grossensis]MDU7152023.1 type I-E CRISPR-associated protein Cse2/CasB [Peptoniphilus grossensis]